MAEKNNSGSTVVGAQIKINDPDDNLVLGLEAKTQILIGEAKDALIISNSYVNYDVDGAFVYVVSDGVVAKRHVETGLVNDMNAQIISGVSADDQVIEDLPDDISEGTAVTPVVQ